MSNFLSFFESMSAYLFKIIKGMGHNILTSEALEEVEREGELRLLENTDGFAQVCRL